MKLKVLKLSWQKFVPKQHLLQIYLLDSMRYKQERVTYQHLYLFLFQYSEHQEQDEISLLISLMVKSQL